MEIFSYKVFLAFDSDFFVELIIYLIEIDLFEAVSIFKFALLMV
jgi:hypothetical protein